ncbi:carbohydrate ABC transporter substrate-binding protein (CUT1 family) [Murinocardiopsis flavida]|uniref:Carbohydrate ABC transporter substrate-binding protein (CUT1 family) n=1 Tax=Murinocardiopsis flavida TaxID=645275 RepID=A0A2P8CW20_9ACTN|nr:sugar ABC transporter substrate-binding protein [Murinocardiopsis flavida]PSK89174.1 carbohydrate ABC transporter substrate-binding protein (CUT1 family) [Murinocardiopsis flavida]
MVHRHRHASPPGHRGPDRRALLRGGLGLGAAAALAPALAGCGPSEADAPLSFWSFNGDAPQQEGQVQQQSRWYLDIIDDWNAANRQQVKAQYIPLAVYNNGSKLPTAFAAGDGPDLFVISPGDFLRYYNGGVLEDLTPHITAEARTDFLPNVLDTRSVGGRVYALPFEVEPIAMFYSVASMEAAGLSEADIPKTWDDLLDTGDKLRSAGQGGIALETVPGYYQNFVWYPLLWQTGGDVVTPGGKVVFDSPEAVKALGLWKDMVEAGISPRRNPAAGDAVTGFTQGLVSMWHRGIWTVKEMETSAPDFEYGVFRLPIPDGGTYVTSLGGWAFAANAQGRNPDAAARFCAEALASMSESSIDRVTEWSIGVKTDIPPRTSALERADASGGYDRPVMKAFREEIYAGGRSEPRFPPIVYKAVSDAIQSCMLAGGDPAVEAERAAEKIDGFMLTYEGAKLL